MQRGGNKAKGTFTLGAKEMQREVNPRKWNDQFERPLEQERKKAVALAASLCFSSDVCVHVTACLLFY